MSEDTTNKERRKPWGCVVLVLLPIVYLLGFGPAIWISNNTSSPAVRSLVRYAYAPLIWVAAWTGLDLWLFGAMEPYLKLWQ